MEGMVYASLRYSTIARGRITALDTGAAEATAGVVLVMTHRNAPRMQPPPLFLTEPLAAGGSDLPVMQTTASTGMASRSRSSWPRRTSRPTTPHR